MIGKQYHAASNIRIQSHAICDEFIGGFGTDRMFVCPGTYRYVLLCVYMIKYGLLAGLANVYIPQISLCSSITHPFVFSGGEYDYLTQ